MCFPKVWKQWIKGGLRESSTDVFTALPLPSRLSGMSCGLNSLRGLYRGDVEQDAALLCLQIQGLGYRVRGSGFLGFLGFRDLRVWKVFRV